MAWRDNRSGNNDIYAQRVSGGGVVQWMTDGVPLCTAGGPQVLPAIVPDSAGGAIVSWMDNRSSTINADTYAQRISAGGAVQWTPDGVPLCTAAGNQSWPALTIDGAGGAIAAWKDSRSTNNDDTYAQRISIDGVVQWAANGVALCSATGYQGDPSINSDGAGGALVAWLDRRTVTNSDIYVQRISADGTGQWTADGVAVCTAAGDQWGPTLAVDGTGAAIIAWADNRVGNYDIYAQRVQADGRLGGDAGTGVAHEAPLALRLDPVCPNPSRGGALAVRFTLGSAAAASLELLDVTGRRITRREVGSFGAGPHGVDLGGGGRLASGLYFVCLRQGAGTRVTRAVVVRTD